MVAGSCPVTDSVSPELANSETGSENAGIGGDIEVASKEAAEDQPLRRLSFVAADEALPEPGETAWAAEAA